MEAAESVLHGIVGRLSSWFPAPASSSSSSSGGNKNNAPDISRMSREFWMPDQSCRVCYECESQFTIFNRRHHCRICGRVFCGRCTVNAVAASGIANEEGERIRVCKFCYGLRQQLESASNSEAVVTPTLSPTSSSRSSLFSTNTSGTSMASPTAASKQFGADMNDLYYENKQKSHLIQEDLRDGVVDPSSSFYGRSDDEEEDRKENQGSRRKDVYDGFYPDGEDLSSRHRDNFPGHSRSESVENKDEHKSSGYHSNSSQSENRGSVSRRSCDDIEGLEDEANFHGQLYEAAYSEVEQPVDFENNKLVWIPPPPEDDEDEAGPAYDEDDDDDESGWGLPRSSGSFNGGDFRTRERAASEEHRKAMRSVVDGHFRALVAQLLKGEDIPVEDEDDKDSWLELVTSLALEAASIVKPDSSRGGSMDPGGYVKVKCVASGRRSDSTIVKGIVCKKNLAHKRMTTRFKNPRLLLLGGALEYQRVSNLSSVDVLLQQEKDYLNMAVARIEAHHPNVVLVEQGVARFAQDRLLAKEISLVLKVKRPLLERIARCTGAQVVLSPDHLSNPKTGHCELFHMEKFVEEHGSAGQGGKPLTKTLMFFEGCPKPLGCTVLLRGANGDELKKIKRVLHLSVFAAYHLALETSFLADEGATLPDHRSPISWVTLPSKQSSSDRSITSVPGFTISGDAQIGRGIPFLPHQINSNASHSGGFTANGPLANGSNGHPGNLQMAFSQRKLEFSALGKVFDDEGGVFFSSSTLDGVSKSASVVGRSITVEVPEEIPAELNRRDQHADNDAEDDPSGKDDFPPTPSDHQNILVSLSTRCITKGKVCERQNIVRIKYYGNSDKPLGRFLRDTLFDLNNRCQHCEESPDAHIRCYTHRLGSLTISVRRLDSENILPGERDGKIWMWHRCLKCPRVDGLPPFTRRIVMSDAAWGLSFGKFLELSFSNHAAVSRVAACGHSLHRDCLRFYGFGNMIACFRYAAVHLHAVHLPPHKLEFHHPLQQEWLKKEAEEVAIKGELVFAEVLDALRVIGEHIASSGSFSGTGRIAEVRRRAVHLENLFQTEKAVFEEALLKAAPLRAEPGQPIADILELNRLRRDLYLRALEWDKRLYYFASSQQRKFSTNSDTAVLLDASKDKSQLLKTYSNADVGGIIQAFAESVNDSDKASDTNSPTDAQSSPLCTGDLVTDSPTCLPLDQKPDNNLLDSGDGDIRRTLSEGHCPTDISLTLDAAWVGQQGHAAETSVSTVEVDTNKKEAYMEHSESESEADRSKTNTLTPSSSRQSLQQTDVQQKANEDMDEIGNWIGGPYSTLYRGRTSSSTSNSPKSLGDGLTSRVAQVAIEGSGRVFFPVGVNGIVVPVYEEEPTSVIANALVSQYYAAEVSNDKEKRRERENGELPSSEEHSGQAEASLEANGSVKEKLNKPGDDPLLNAKGVNLKIENAEVGPEAKLKYTVIAWYAKHFDALRKRCCNGDLDVVRSLCRCRKWGAQGGKSNVFFAKTLDDRFIIKQVTRTELLSFLDFAPEYFRYFSESLNSGSPTSLAKILGMYQVVIKQIKGGKEIRMDLMVMENLLYARRPTKMYDLKGSVRSRYNSDSTGKNAVLLDQNLLESMPTAPIFVGNKAKRVLERAVWNDTAFLANIDVMDYSLLVGIDEEKSELVVGIIDCVRQYTWDKHLETWVKASGILGGKNAPPTVISPKQYKKRFRKAMSTYFVTVPDHWTPPPPVITAQDSTSSRSQQAESSNSFVENAFDEQLRNHYRQQDRGG